MDNVTAETLEDEQSLLDDVDNPVSGQIEKITAEIESFNLINCKCVLNTFFIFVINLIL